MVVIIMNHTGHNQVDVAMDIVEEFFQDIVVTKKGGAYQRLNGKDYALYTFEELDPNASYVTFHPRMVGG